MTAGGKHRAKPAALTGRLFLATQSAGSRSCAVRTLANSSAVRVSRSAEEAIGIFQLYRDLWGGRGRRGKEQCSRLLRLSAGFVAARFRIAVPPCSCRIGSLLPQAEGQREQPLPALACLTEPRVSQRRPPKASTEQGLGWDNRHRLRKQQSGLFECLLLTRGSRSGIRLGLRDRHSPSELSMLHKSLRRCIHAQTAMTRRMVPTSCGYSTAA